MRPSTDHKNENEPSPDPALPLAPTRSLLALSSRARRGRTLAAAGATEDKEKPRRRAGRGPRKIVKFSTPVALGIDFLGAEAPESSRLLENTRRDASGDGSAVPGFAKGSGFLPPPPREYTHTGRGRERRRPPPPSAFLTWTAICGNIGNERE
jgi:hypothetical protein